MFSKCNNIMLKLDCQHICTYFQRMARKFNQDFVMDLPYREKLEIFLQLSGEDLVSCRSVSSAWRSYIHNMFQNRGLRSILSHRLETNWKKGRHTQTGMELVVEFPFHIAAMASKLVCLRTPTDTPLHQAVVRILDVTSYLYWDVPNLFSGVYRYGCPDFAIAMSDTLLAVRTELRTFGPPLWNLQVYNINTKSKVADENIVGLLNFHASQTNEQPETLILFRGLINRK